MAMQAPPKIDLDRFCCGCGSDQHTEPRDGVGMLWCNVCWDWQRPVPSELRRYISYLLTLSEK